MSVAFCLQICFAQELVIDLTFHRALFIRQEHKHTVDRLTCPIALEELSSAFASSPYVVTLPLGIADAICSKPDVRSSSTYLLASYGRALSLCPSGHFLSFHLFTVCSP